MSQQITAQILINHIKNTQGLSDKKKAIIIKLIESFETGKNLILSQIVNFLKNHEFTNTEINFTYKVLVKKYSSLIQVDNTKPLPVQNASQASTNNEIKQIVLKYINYVLDMLKNSEIRSLQRRILMFELDCEINKKWPISNWFFTFLRQFPFMLELDNPDEIQVISKEREFLLPLQNYLCKNIIKPLKDIINKPGHVKIETFIMETGLKDENYINLTAALEQKHYIMTNKDEVIFITTSIDKNRNVYQEMLDKTLKTMNVENREEVIQKMDRLYQSSLEIDANDSLLHTIYTSAMNKNYNLMQADFNLLDELDWTDMPENIDYTRVFCEVYGLFSHFYSTRSGKKDGDTGTYCYNLVNRILVLFNDPDTPKENICPDVSRMSRLNMRQAGMLNRILSFSYFLPGKTFNNINSFYNQLDNSIKNSYRKQFDTFCRDIKAELP